jgi:hypothetical protein
MRAKSPTSRSFARYGAVAAAVVVTLSTAGPVAAGEPSPAPETPEFAAAGFARAVVDAATVVQARTRTVTPSGEPTTAPPAAPPPVVEPATPLVVVASYGFDQGGRVVADLSGHGNTLRTRARKGGKIRVVKHDLGKALAFPRACAAARCARVVLQAPHNDKLNPGTAPFAFGATIRLGRKQTSKGQNIVQKGYSARGSQFKLQIDGAAGKPSCVIVGVNKPRIRVVKSSVTVANGRWHRVECRRIGAALAILVDGVVRGVSVVPANLSVANKSPLSLGGKGGYKNNDQFQGAFDDVFVSIG